MIISPIAITVIRNFNIYQKSLKTSLSLRATRQVLQRLLCTKRSNIREADKECYCSRLCIKEYGLLPQSVQPSGIGIGHSATMRAHAPAWRIAVNFAKLPEFLAKRKSPGDG